MDILFYKKEEKEDLLLHIVRHLIINTDFLSNLGIFHGKMGVVLFFFHYLNIFKNEIIEEYLEYLLQDICQSVHTNIPVDFANGICGIGWGINFLLENRYIDGDPNVVLRNFDKKIMEKNIKYINDFTFDTGIMGIACYVKKRTNCKYKGISNFSSLYLNDLAHVTRDLVIPEDDEILKNIIASCEKNVLDNKKELGLKNGYAGYGLKLLQI